MSACCWRRDRRSAAHGQKRPSLEKDGQPAIAKFPRKDDEINTVVREKVARRGEAARHALEPEEIDRMGSAFEHEDLEGARRLL